MRKPRGWKNACAVFLLCVATPIASPARTFTTLATFAGGNGASPEYGSLVQGFDGNFYGTTFSGGANGRGIVFEITPGGTLTTLYSFCPQITVCPDGANPFAGLVQATDGNFYGTTFEGGANNYGTVFKITPRGTLRTLHMFDGTDGAYSYAALIQATDGNFYGTTGYGGANNVGTVFKITSGGTLATLYSFCLQTSCTDGSGPYGALVQATDGNFYGTTVNGGANGLGTVFTITSGGTLRTLYSFCAKGVCADGRNPLAGLVQGIDGSFYGTTLAGGASVGNDTCNNVGCGTVFEITHGGTLRTLYSFCAQTHCPDGSDPFGALVQATDGNFYGTTSEGGANKYGTVFEITHRGTLRTLYSFCAQTNCTDGSDPYGALVQATDGSFYGTTYQGGAPNYGTVFSLSVGLNLFVETLPNFGEAGAAVRILGTDLTGATGVTFNGTASTFTVISSSRIGKTKIRFRNVPRSMPSSSMGDSREGGSRKSHTGRLL